MIVVDASALFQVLDRSGAASAIEARLFSQPLPICVPYLVDAEISSVLRRHVLRGQIDQGRAQRALSAFLKMPLIRFEHVPLLPRAFMLRDRFSAYDALYVVLAETLRAPLLTCDRRLAKAANAFASVEVY